jgi:hypothetical protein
VVPRPPDATRCRTTYLDRSRPFRRTFTWRMRRPSASGHLALGYLSLAGATSLWAGLCFLQGFSTLAEVTPPYLARRRGLSRSGLGLRLPHHRCTFVSGRLHPWERSQAHTSARARGLASTLGQRCRRESGLSGGTAQNQPDRRFLSAVSAGTRFSWRGWRYRRRRSRSASGPESSASSDHGMALRGCRSRCMAPPSETRSSRNLVAVTVCDARLPSV